MFHRIKIWSCFFFVAMVLSSCGLPDQGPLSQTERIDGMEFSITKSRRYRVRAESPRGLVFGLAGIANNEVELYFFKRKAHGAESPVSAMELSTENIKPFMPTMGHGNHNQGHKVHAVAGTTNGFRVTEIYFNMASTGQHKWVLMIKAKIEGHVEEMVIELESVVSQRVKPTVDGKPGVQLDCKKGNPSSSWPKIDPSELRAQIIDPPESLGMYDEKIKLGFFARNMPYRGAYITKADLWMNMHEGNGHPSSEVAIEWDKVKDASHVFHLKGLTFSMPSVVFGEEIGQWELRLKICVDGEEMDREVFLPDVMEQEP